MNDRIRGSDFLIHEEERSTMYCLYQMIYDLEMEIKTKYPWSWSLPLYCLLERSIRGRIFLLIEYLLKQGNLALEWMISGESHSTYPLAFLRVVLYRLFYSTFLSRVSLGNTKQNINTLMMVPASSAAPVEQSKALWRSEGFYRLWRLVNNGAWTELILFNIQNAASRSLLALAKVFGVYVERILKS